MSFAKFFASVSIAGVFLSLLGGTAIAQPSPSDYFPLAVGDHWKYTGGEVGEPPDRWTFIDVVGDTTFGIPGEILSYKTKYSEHIFGQPDTSVYNTTYYSYNENGDLCLSALQTDTLDVFDPLIIYLQNPIVVGDSTHLVGDGYEATWTVLSVSDTLDLPLGQFDNCLLIHSFMVVDGQPAHEEYQHYIPCAQVHASIAGLGRLTGTHWNSYPDSARHFYSYLTECNIEPCGAFVSDFSRLPNSLNLDQNYPNPFNPSTQIAYELPQAGHVSLKILDLLGREVATLVDGVQPMGSHSVTFDGSGLASGIYFCRLQAGDFSATKKMVLLK